MLTTYIVSYFFAKVVILNHTDKLKDYIFLISATAAECFLQEFFHILPHLYGSYYIFIDHDYFRNTEHFLYSFCNVISSILPKFICMSR